MHETARTILAYDDRQQDEINAIKRALAQDSSTGMGNGEFFLLALGLGFSAGMSVEDFKRSNNGVRIDYVRKDQDFLMLLTAIHLHSSGTTDNIVNFDSILNTAERFAAAGVKILSQAMTTAPDLRLWLQAQVNEAYRALDLQKPVDLRSLE
jgi:hypothetical protein